MKIKIGKRGVYVLKLITGDLEKRLNEHRKGTTKTKRGLIPFI